MVPPTVKAEVRFQVMKVPSQANTNLCHDKHQAV